MDRRSALLLLALGATSTATASKMRRAETPGDSSILFVGDYETGDTSQYAANELGVSVARPKVITSLTRGRDSVYACAYGLSNDQNRCESVPAYSDRCFVATEGSDLYYGWSVYFDENLPKAPWQICGQWHQSFLGGSGPFDAASPPMAFYVASTTASQGTRWCLANNGSNPWERGWSLDLGPVPRGEWTDIVVRAKFSIIPSKCYVEVWINGVSNGSVVPPVPTLYPTDEVVERVSYFKVGYYRDPTTLVPGRVIYDNVKIGADYSSVQPSS